jgi:hypothetical protein
MSILSDVKTSLGVSDGAFDQDLLTIIRSELSSLVQMGVNSLNLEDVNETTGWPTIEPLPNAVVSIYKTILIYRVKKVFDPPSNATLFNSLEETLSEYEFRLDTYLSELEPVEGTDPGYDPIDLAEIFAQLGSNIFTGDQSLSGHGLLHYSVKEVSDIIDDVYEIDLSKGTLFSLVVVADSIITFTNTPPQGYAASVTVYLTQGVVGNHSVVFPGVKWPDGLVPDLARAAGVETDLSFVIHNGGIDIRGYLVSENMS